MCVHFAGLLLLDRALLRLFEKACTPSAVHDRLNTHPSSSFLQAIASIAYGWCANWAGKLHLTSCLFACNGEWPLFADSSAAASYRFCHRQRLARAVPPTFTSSSDDSLILCHRLLPGIDCNSARRRKDSVITPHTCPRANPHPSRRIPRSNQCTHTSQHNTKTVGQCAPCNT